MEDGPVTVTVDLNAPPTVAAAPATPKPENPAFTGAPGNFAADMAALEAEQTQPVAAVAPVEVATPTPETPPQPEITDTATAPVTVPDKFKDAEGNPDPAKIAKSTADAEAALAKYLAKEKELRQKMNEVNGLAKAAPQITPTAPAPSSFEAQIEADIAKHGAGAVLARLFESAKEVAKKEVLSDVMADREERAEMKSRRELEEIGRHDQDVLTPQGLERLAQIRAERPWLNQSPNPTEAAYEVLLAERVKNARQTGTVLPTPKGVTAKAPPTPVTPAPRAVVKPAEPVLNTKEDIDRHLASLDDKGRDEFFRKRGFRI